MASKAPPEIANICPVCFETRPLKIAGGCKHSICTECLTIAIGSQDGDVFSCPTCQADCPRPWDGVEGLVDFTGEEVAIEDLGPVVEQEGTLVGRTDITSDQDEERRNERKETREIVMVRCKICRHKKKDILAMNLCIQCDHLYICGDCTEVHAKNKATHGHIVIPLYPTREKQLAVCIKHDSAFDSYCQECKEAVCVVCVMLEHGDHTMEKLGDLVEANVEALEVTLEENEERLKKLVELEEELTLLTRITPVVDKQDILIKEIEDHAQDCIDKIVKWKEDLKGKVTADYQIIRDIPECLKKVSERVQKMQGPIKQAGLLLAQTEHQPKYLDKLMKLQQDFEALADRGVEEGASYADQLKQLDDKDCCFAPVRIDSLGKIERAKAKKGDFKPEEIFKLTMPVDSNEKFIPCVANLGKRFAIAHPIREGQPSDAIDIYDFPGKLKHTFRDHVPPLYDMSATPDGKLAVLSDGSGATSRCVKLFDSETGYINSTRDFDIAKPLSLGVTLQHQYVILGDNEQEERQITVVDKDGTVEYTHVIKEEIKDEQINPSSITCGGRFIFVTWKLGCFSYEMTDTGICGIGMCFSFREPDNTHGVDISANVWDGFHYTGIFKDNFYCNKHTKDTNYAMLNKWTNEGYAVLLYSLTGADRQTSVSTKGSLIVVSHGQTIRVYKV